MYKFVHLGCKTYGGLVESGKAFGDNHRGDIVGRIGRGGVAAACHGEAD
jgi:hypothetical protein